MRHPFFRRITDWSASLRPAIAVALALPALVACNSEPVPEDAVRPEPRPVRTVAAREAGGAEQLRLPGALRARRQARLAFLESGYLAERASSPGQRVAQGQPVALLYNPALQPGVAAARADVRRARTRLEQLEADTRRQAALRERDLIAEDTLEQTRSQRDAARAALEQAEAELARAEAQLEDAVLRAPFAGRVARVHAEPGDFVAAGQPVLTLADPDELEVEVHLRPDAAGRLATGDRAELIVADSGRSVPGRVAEIGQAQPGRSVPVVVVPEDGRGLTPGGPVYVGLGIVREPLPAVPLGAVVDPGTGYGRVFRVVDGRAERVPVLVGRLRAGWVEVRGELAAGDAVVVAGQANLLDGEPVRVLQ
jgi:multidrug efflux system membrane fusion protein